jgi:hypothetical protein
VPPRRSRKSPSDFGHEPSIVAEDVERRTDLRGPVRDLDCKLPGGETVRVLEAGRRAIFIALDDPDRFPLGARLEVEVGRPRGKHVTARVEVVRKEIDPRRGVALLLVHLSPAAKTAYEAMLS